MKKIAIIGSGIAGMAAAYYLKDRYDVEVFEKDTRVGGHTHTHSVPESDNTIAIDTGFIVHNDYNYPGFKKLLTDLNVGTVDSDMSFSVYNRSLNLQFSGEGLSKLFAQRRNLFSPRHYRFLLQANRFNKEAPGHVMDGRADLTLGEYLTRHGYDSHFTENYIFPMACAVWSIGRNRIQEFHAESFIRFFMNHGFLGLSGGRQWKTVAGGSSSYMHAIQASLRKPVRTDHAVKKVVRSSHNVTLHTNHGSFTFDAVIIAAHADQALKMLDGPSARELALLGAFDYSYNRATLHRDESVMPPLRKIWASWNQKVERTGDGQLTGSTIYFMNRLQRLNSKYQYFVSINEMDSIDPEKQIAVIDYEHPIFTERTARAQRHLPDLNQSGPVYFSGSYFGYGFHEDALASTLAVVDRLL